MFSSCSRQTDTHGLRNGDAKCVLLHLFPRCHKQAGIDILNFNRRYKTPHSGSGVGRMVDKQRYAMYVQKSMQKRNMPMCQYLANPTPKPT